MNKKRIGNLGEAMAEVLLVERGYQIIARNFRCKFGEVDIIARKGGVMAFVEVKTRTREHLAPHEARPAASVTPEKQRKIIKAAKFFPRNPDKAMRFDVIEVIYSEGQRKPEINHLISTFNYNTAHRR